MIVEFIKAAHVLGEFYSAGAIADIDADDANELIRRNVCRFYGDGDQHSYTWTDLVQSAVGVNPVGAVAPPVVDETETGFPGSLLFSGSADQLLTGSWQLLHEWREGSAIRPHIHWMLTADSASAVGWEFYYRISGIGAVAGAWVGPVAGTLAVTHNNTANTQALSTFGEIAMTGHTVSTLVFWRLYRRGSTDANNDTARLLSIDAHYQKDGTGSKHEYIKD